jgi:hypothetical protein
MGAGGGFYKDIYFPRSHFRISKTFYPNGYIKSKGLFGRDFKKGTWFYFNQSGRLIREVDYDAPFTFTFTFEDVIAFCKKNGHDIRLIKGFTPRRGLSFDEGHLTTRITRETFGRNARWEIEYFSRLRPGVAEFTKTNIILDGRTGKVLSKETVPWFFN